MRRPRRLITSEFFYVGQRVFPVQKRNQAQAVSFCHLRHPHRRDIQAGHLGKMEALRFDNRALNALAIDPELCTDEQVPFQHMQVAAEVVVDKAAGS